MNRRWDLDALRGLMLVLMALTHLPTRFSGPTGQPFGFVSAAEGFVLLSAYMAGMVYTGRAMKDGEPVMQEAFFKRALKIYFCQAALLLFLFTVIAAIGVIDRQDAVMNLLTFYLERPWTAFVSGLLLIYSPPLLDILPMYILLMLASPLLLLHGMHRGWRGILIVSVGLWFTSQFDVAMTAYNAFGGWAHLKLIPYNELGSFELFAWQFIWVLGLWMGSTAAASPKAPPLQFPRWLVRCAIAMALVGFVWRHAIGQSPFYDDLTLNMLWDKWHVGPLRLLDFLSLLLLTMHYGPWLKVHLPRIKWLETMGSGSLPVFCAHLVLALLALAVFGEAKPDRKPAIDVGIIVISFAVMYGVAWLSQQADQRAAALKKQRAARRAEKAIAAPSPRPLPNEASVAAVASRGGLKSQPSTTHNRRG
jgi:hypothetical protein